MTLGERIKKLRKELDLTQQEIGKRIGIKPNSISLIESGNRNASEQVILAICREFNVSEKWLRTGEGEMMVELPRNEALAAEIRSFLQGGTDSFRERLISLLIRLEPEQWEALEGYMMGLVKAPAPPTPPTAQPDTTGQERTVADTGGQERAEPDLAAKVAELERQNQEMAARMAAMEEEDAKYGLTDVFSASPSVSVGKINPAGKAEI